MNRSLLTALSIVLLLGAGAWYALRPRLTDPAHAAGPEAPGRVEDVAEPAEPSAPRSLEPQLAPAERVALESAPRPALPEATGDAGARHAGVALSGSVQDEQGRPVEGARVLAATFEGAMAPLQLDSARRFGGLVREARTGSDGRFSLELEHPGSLQIAVRASGFAPLDDDRRVVPAGASHDLGTLSLERGAIVTGRVVDPRGSGVGGARLGRIPVRDSFTFVVFGGAGDEAIPLGTTGADGSFVLDVLPAGELELSVQSDEHPGLRHKLERLALGERRDGVILRLEPGATISGVALDVPAALRSEVVLFASPRREAAGGDMVFSEDPGESREARIADDGSFRVRGLKESKGYDLSLRRRRGDEPAAFSQRLSPRVTARSGDRGVEVRFLPESSIVFTVIDASTRAPVEEYDVQGGLEEGSFSFLGGDTRGEGRRHPEGKGRLEGLRPRSATASANLRIRATGYRDHERKEIPVSQGQELDLGVIELTPAPVQQVTVLDADTGRPVPGARVTLRENRPESGAEGLMVRSRAISVGGSGDLPDDLEFDEPGSEVARTDADGVARLTSLEGRSCTLTVEHKTHAPYRSEPFTCAVGQRELREVRLGEGGSVRVRLVDSAGQPVAGGRIEHRAAAGGSPQGLDFLGGGNGREVTDASGEALFRYLTPGKHRFRPEASANGVFGGGGLRFEIAGMPDTEDSEWADVVVVDRQEASVQLVAPLRVALRGTITEGRQGLPDATVSLAPRREGESGMRGLPFFGGGPEARTDSRGRFELAGIKAGTYTATITHAARTMPTEVEVVIGTSDESLDLDLDVAIIEGRVTGPDGKPVANARVTAEREQGAGGGRGAVRVMMMSVGGDDETVIAAGGPDKEVRTDADGRYVLRGVQPNVKLVVKAEAKGFDSARVSGLELGPNEVESGVDLRLTQAGKLEVSVFRGAEPATEVIVTAYREGTSPAADDAKRTVPRNGKASFDGLGTGRWVVEARPFAPRDGGEPATPVRQTVEIRPNETAETRLDL